MPDIGDLWLQLKDILEKPWVGTLLTLGQILWGVLIVALGGVAWLYKNVLKTISARIVVWLRGLPVKIYAELGLVTQVERAHDQAAVQAELQRRDNHAAMLEKEIGALKAARSAPVTTPVNNWAGPKTVERFGVKFDLVDPIGTYLGKFDPPAVPWDVIHAFLHGPFCRNCNHTLTEKVWVNTVYIDYVNDQCAACSFAWRKSRNPRQMVSDLKRRAYEVLDAEFRSNGKVAATDRKPGFGDFLVPPKPW